MIDEIQQYVQDNVNESVNILKESLARLYISHATPELLSDITIEYHGIKAPLSEVAAVVAEDKQTLHIAVFDRGMVPAVEQAIVESQAGFSSRATGATIRIALPPLTAARQRDLNTIIRGRAERARMEIRSVHKDANSVLKMFLDDDVISAVEYREGQKLVQTATDTALAQVNEALAAKEKEFNTPCAV